MPGTHTMGENVDYRSSIDRSRSLFRYKKVATTNHQNLSLLLALINVNSLPASSLPITPNMKLSHLATALGMSHLAAASVANTAARGPYDAAFDQHCGSGQAQGTLTVDGKTFSYYCNVAQSTGNSYYIKLSTPEKCTDVCDDDDDCDTAVWDRSQGQCWLGQGTGNRVPFAGRMVIAELDPLAKCEASLSKYRPGAPTCK